MTTEKFLKSTKNGWFLCVTTTNDIWSVKGKNVKFHVGLTKKPDKTSWDLSFILGKTLFLMGKIDYVLVRKLKEQKKTE